MPPRKPTSANEITRLAAQMRVADPNVDNGAFSSLTTDDAMAWIMALGHINEIDPRMKTAANPQKQREIAIENLRRGLWDVQRFEYPGLIRGRTGKKPHPEIRAGGMGRQKLDGYKDAQRMASYVLTHFNLLAFTQPQMMEGLPMNPPKGRAGNWIGVKKIMGHAALDITAEGGLETPFVVYYHKDIMLIMEILDVKRVSWPEPGPKLLEQLKEAQESKFGARPGAPLVPMMQTPKIPLVVVRYSYMEGRPKDGAEFVLHLESRLREILPSRLSDDDVRVELEKHLTSGEEMPEEHIRMFARLLSHNADLVDKEWADDQQSHWNISKEASKETRISFFVPCLRPRFEVVEEIETGKKVTPHAQCGNCQKHAKTMCGSCFGVSYCSPDCAKAQWPTHKLVCKISKKITSDPSALPKDTLYIPARAYIHWVLDFGFASEQECVKMGGPPVDEPPRNQYGGERFICRALLANAGKGQWDPHQGKVVYYDKGLGTAFLHDRRRSVMVRLGPQEPAKARVHGVEIPFHEAGYRQFAQVMREKGMQGQLLYVYVRRVGDCIEVDLKDIPNQQGIMWE
ncbi:Ankyrin repeat and mynd domain-containing protein 2-like [Mycena sanguinolenta]|uniref:Ankyrin repeat and mynd domain-containing protein 2-like n=1 Tax=Mycena sanguinolenta TaxID=230812 RepID=A0A8H7CF23_9AGAR|nr:Ankyrin repeat and mynd domain-containing protein 2-like [Mycena sanguinolenta]